MANEEKNKRVEVIIHAPGESLPALLPETDGEIKRLDPFSLYLMHVFVQGIHKVGGSADKKVARSYVPRAISEIFPDNPPLKPERTNQTEIFWCSSVAKSYIGLLNSVAIPLSTDTNWQIGYWNNNRRAKIEVAATLEEAIHKAESTIGKDDLEIHKDKEKNRVLLRRSGLVLAAIIGQATQPYRDLARHQAKLNKNKPLN